jgi:hypothetical protein
LRKEANPDKDVIAIATKRMTGANAIEREATEETIQIRIVKCPGGRIIGTWVSRPSADRRS